MGIFRGVGGTGESSSDSTINATTALANAAAASAAAALASELAAETAETNAASSASAASTSASSASSSASSASTSATNASASASSASSSASTATTQASAASTSATNAATSETNAASSASSASTSASTATTQASTATTKASEAATSATNAASSASAASTSETNAASSASTASTAATTATTKASEASTSASNAATSATNAAASATTASTQASNASTSATNASNSASSASTSATNAAASASTATTQASNASTSATNAAASASSASTSATTATTQATNASNSAATATTQATNASNSATSAASSAAAAASALDSFDDRYLGSKSSDPTLDNDGNALLTGALYYNTTTQTMKVYDGANWITATAAGTTALLVYKYVATSGQTTFSGAASVGGTLSYTSNNIIVFVNGVSLDSTDYTATNGTSVVLASGAALNDEVVIVAFKSFTVANTYTKGEVDAFAVKLTGAQTVAGVKTFSSAPVLPSASIPQAALAAGVAGNGPAFSYYQSVAQTLTSYVTTKITFTTSEFDTTGGMYASSRFTPTVAGYYQVNSCISMASSITGVQLILYKNGASYKYLFNVISTTVVNGAAGSALVYLNGSTDYIEIYGVFATGQNTLALAPNTYFQAAMVRSA